MAHVAKTSQERQAQEEKSGTKLPKVEPTEEQKEMLNERLKRFFADSTPGPFQRKQAPEPRTSAPDSTGFEAVQAAIQELVDKKKDATGTALATDLEPHPEPPAPEQSTTSKQSKLSRRQRAAAAKKLKATNKHDDNLEPQPSSGLGSDVVHAEAVTITDSSEISQREMVELHALQQAVIDAQARLDAFLEAHPGMIKATDYGDTAESKQPMERSTTCSAGQGRSDTYESVPDMTDKASAPGPMTRLINVANEQFERQQQQQQQQQQQLSPSPSPASAPSQKSKTAKEEAPTNKQMRNADPKSDVLRALKQMKKDIEGNKF